MVVLQMGSGPIGHARVSVFHKNNIGPPCGNRYALFVEEEWVDDGVALIPGVDVSLRAEPLPLANGNNLISQEMQSANKGLHCLSSLSWVHNLNLINNRCCCHQHSHLCIA
ncbi:unnamed protein product [Eruca vesicaria subsp. sativa]|uniref:Uncharacterized protein n=1 Tax=Eruca vesicaria subsp. sativa TaxID=29727 RepID=A0ABC8J6G3_ERUVS|nr:unnamed protein product [Eruca vesicaria subsp. sativa]